MSVTPPQFCKKVKLIKAKSKYLVDYIVVYPMSVFSSETEIIRHIKYMCTS